MENADQECIQRALLRQVIAEISNSAGATALAQHVVLLGAGEEGCRLAVPAIHLFNQHMARSIAAWIAGAEGAHGPRGRAVDADAFNTLVTDLWRRMGFTVVRKLKGSYAALKRATDDFARLVQVAGGWRPSQVRCCYPLPVMTDD